MTVVQEVPTPIFDDLKRKKELLEKEVCTVTESAPLPSRDVATKIEIRRAEEKAKPVVDEVTVVDNFPELSPEAVAKVRPVHGDGLWSSSTCRYAVP